MSEIPALPLDEARGILPDTALDELLGKYQSGEVVVLHIEARKLAVAVRIENISAAHKAFKVAIFDPKRQPFAAEEYLKNVTVYPARPELLKLKDRLPFLFDRLAMRAMELAGADEDVDGKKD